MKEKQSNFKEYINKIPEQKTAPYLITVNNRSIIKSSSTEIMTPDKRQK